MKGMQSFEQRLRRLEELETAQQPAELPYLSFPDQAAMWADPRAALEGFGDIKIYIGISPDDWDELGAADDQQ